MGIAQCRCALSSIRYSPSLIAYQVGHRWFKHKPARSRLEQDPGADGRRRGGASRRHDDPAGQPARHRRQFGDAVALAGRTVVFAYPRTGEPGKIALVDDWDMIPARAAARRRPARSATCSRS
jgi:hypothetical protein